MEHKEMDMMAGMNLIAKNIPKGKMYRLRVFLDMLNKKKDTKSMYYLSRFGCHCKKQRKFLLMS